MNAEEAKLLTRKFYHHIHDDDVICAPCEAKGYLAGWKDRGKEDSTIVRFMAPFPRGSILHPNNYAQLEVVEAILEEIKKLDQIRDKKK